MKLRWSNGYSWAISFEANDLASFRDAGLSALRSFRIATERRVHRGEIHKTVSWFAFPELGIRDANHENQWWCTGSLKTMDTPSLGVISYYEPKPTRVLWHEAENLSQAFEKDAAWMDTNAEKTWQMVYDTWSWGLTLINTVMTLGDELRRATEE